MEKKYEIKTIEDILAAVNSENVDVFVRDFKAFLLLHLLNRSVHEAVGEKRPPEMPQFTWIDDGKNDIKITLGVRKDGATTPPTTKE